MLPSNAAPPLVLACPTAGSQHRSFGQNGHAPRASSGQESELGRLCHRCLVSTDTSSMKPSLRPLKVTLPRSLGT